MSDRLSVVAIVSGGMDSTVLAYDLAMGGCDLHILSFDYGQRHKRELSFAKKTAKRLNAVYHVVNIQPLNSLLKGSALTDSSVEVPHGHYAAETMKATVVPNRNSIMLNIATGYAVSVGAESVCTAVHAGDHAVYPDCRPEFIHSLTQTLRIANEGFIHPDFVVSAPFVGLTKADIARLGDTLGVPFQNTWSCYEGGEIHCGRCSTCVERREAFDLAGVVDPTEYRDPDFWRQALNEHAATSG